jgi:hypothetical protein
MPPPVLDQGRRSQPALWRGGKDREAIRGKAFRFEPRIVGIDIIDSKRRRYVDEPYPSGRRNSPTMYANTESVTGRKSESTMLVIAFSADRPAKAKPAKLKA